MRYANIRYSTLLNEAQYDYLSDECQDINRMKCFKTFTPNPHGTDNRD